MANSLSSLTSSKHKDPENIRRGRKEIRLDRLLPVVLLLGFAFLIWFLFGDRLVPTTKVSVTRVITIRAEVEKAEAVVAQGENTNRYEGTSIFKASGWLEADPYITRVTSLYGGVVDEVFVLEGDVIKKGQLLATLIDEDAKLEFEMAQAAVDRREALLKQRLTEEKLAIVRLENWDYDLKSAKARLNELEDDAKRYLKAGPELIPDREIQQAQLRLETQKSKIELLGAQKTELMIAIEGKSAQVLEARADLKSAETALARRELDWNRTKIYSPMDGVIQELYAYPGKKRMLHMDNLESSTIAKIFRPESLQGRIDVPLEEFAKLSIGQAVFLRISLFAEKTFRGVVTSIAGEADIQRNTVQVKVSLLDSDSRLRPEMLVRADFLDSGERFQSGGVSNNSNNGLSIFAPKAALFNSGQDSMVWSLDSTRKVIVKQKITLGTDEKEGNVRILEGLKPGDLVVVNPDSKLKNGERVSYKIEQ